MFLVLASLAVSTGVATAQVDPMFQHLDSNHDGRISLQEHSAAEQATFQRLDANHDGKLTASELKVARLTSSVAEVAANPAMASVAENAAVAQALFDRLDVDHDGRVSSTEMQAAHTRRATDAGGAQAGDGQASLGAGALLDANHDGVVNAAEHAHIARARFAKMDTNQDGFVSAKEFAAAHSAKKPASP
jgi:Ca2+-binding EF-hand superfamily protein